MDPAVDLVLGNLLEGQAEGDVLVNGHMGIQGVVLEDHGDVPVLGSHVVDHPVADVQLAAGDVLQARDHPQSGGLAAAGGAHQDDELLVLNFQIQVGDDGNVAGIGFFYVLEGNAGHDETPPR